MPVALVYHDVPHVVMLATPADLEDFAVGFTLSEGLVARADEIRGVEVTRGEASADVNITVAWERFTQLLQRRRNLTGRTGCGLCGAETAEDAIRECAPVPAGVSISADASCTRPIAQLGAASRSTRAPAACMRRPGWCPGRGIELVREDVGRHNALDKTIGALVRAQATSPPATCSSPAARVTRWCRSAPRSAFRCWWRSRRRRPLPCGWRSAAG